MVLLRSTLVYSTTLARATCSTFCSNTLVKSIVKWPLMHLVQSFSWPGNLVRALVYVFVLVPGNSGKECVRAVTGLRR